MTTTFEITQNTGLIAVSGGSFKIPQIIRGPDVRGGWLADADGFSIVGEKSPFFPCYLAFALAAARSVSLPTTVEERGVEMHGDDLKWGVDLRRLEAGEKIVYLNHGSDSGMRWLDADGKLTPHAENASNYYAEYEALVLAPPAPPESTSGAASDGAGWKALDYPPGAPAATPGTYNPSPAQQLTIAAARQFHADGRFIIANLPGHKLDQKKRGSPDRWRAMAQTSLDMLAKQMTVVVTGENELPEPSAWAVKMVEEIRAAAAAEPGE